MQTNMAETKKTKKNIKVRDVPSARLYKKIPVKKTSPKAAMLSVLDINGNVIEEVANSSRPFRKKHPKNY